MIMRLLKVFALFLLILSMSSCGFRLRGFSGADGIGSLPFKSIYLQGTGGTVEALRRQLVAFTDLKQPATVQDAQVNTTILGEQTDRKILTVNSAGRVSEYRIYLSVAYRIHYHNKVLLENGQLRIFRDYSYNDSAILGKESEQSMLIKDMYQDAASQILRRTTALVHHAQKHGNNASDSATLAPT
jgi:LPS-assembly lipoprotein